MYISFLSYLCISSLKDSAFQNYSFGEHVSITILRHNVVNVYEENEIENSSIYDEQKKLTLNELIKHQDDGKYWNLHIFHAYSLKH